MAGKQTNTDTHGAVVDRLREIAGQAVAGEAIEDAASHPDAELLELCATVLDLTAEANSIDREARRSKDPNITNPKFKEEMNKRDVKRDEARSPMARLSKHPARTAAGIYAKAFVLRTRHGTAPRLAMTLAEDLVMCPGLRALLWPAEGV